MTELETRMRAMLEKTGLYFGEDKWLSAELAAYAKGLELVYDNDTGPHKGPPEERSIKE